MGPETTVCMEFKIISVLIHGRHIRSEAAKNILVNYLETKEF